MTDREFEILKKAQSQQQWGNQLPLIVAQNQQLCFVDVPPYMARSWTINLPSMRYQGGLLAAGFGTPDQQASAGAVAFVQLSYGVAGASEAGILVDYPAGGASFELVAASIQVTFAAPATSAVLNPLVGCFISPGFADRGVSRPPTFTVRNTLVVPVGFANIPIPKRAVSFQVLPATVLDATSGTFTLQQQFTPTNFSGGPETDSPTGFISGTDEDWTGGQTQFRVNPDCTNLHVANLSAVNALQFTVRFELQL